MNPLRDTKYIILLIFLICLFQIGTSEAVYQFKQKAVLIPHPDKAARGGQDAFYSDNQLLIVADGVGGWNDIGVNPANYSRFLCYKGSQLFHSNTTYYLDNLVEVIAQTSRQNQFIGSSTMVVLTLDSDKLKTCYIGDSGFVILRLVNDKYQLHFEFKQQQHSFNFPFQLARKDLNGDDPYLSICQEFEIKQTDIIIAGSDGLFDNIYVSEMVEMINTCLQDEQKLFDVPEKLAQLAIQRGKDKKFWSPFAQRAKQQMLKYQGGKLDDTTVILGRIEKIVKPLEVQVTDQISIIDENAEKLLQNDCEQNLDNNSSNTNNVVSQKNEQNKVQKNQQTTESKNQQKTVSKNQQNTLTQIQSQVQQQAKQNKIQKSEQLSQNQVHHQIQSNSNQVIIQKSQQIKQTSNVNSADQQPKIQKSSQATQNKIQNPIQQQTKQAKYKRIHKKLKTQKHMNQKTKRQIKESESPKN